MSGGPVAIPVPERIVDILGGRPDVGGTEEAVLLVTVDQRGFPRLSLLSRAEVDADQTAVWFTLSGSNTPRNLARTGRATLFVIDGEVAHSCSLVVRAVAERDGMHGYAAEVVDHRQDSAGVELTGIRYVVPDDLPSTERWETSRRLITRMRLDPEGG